MSEIPEPAPMELPEPNLPLLRKVLDHIDAHPEEWHQSAWGLNETVTHCGTAFCVAGHAVLMAGAEPVWHDGRMRYVIYNGEERHVSSLADDVLGLTSDEGDLLFEGYNSREQVQRAAERIAERAGERL